jgi:hypothetical protein
VLCRRCATEDCVFRRARAVLQGSTPEEIPAIGNVTELGSSVSISLCADIALEITIVAEIGQLAARCRATASMTSALWLALARSGSALACERQCWDTLVGASFVT